MNFLIINYILSSVSLSNNSSFAFFLRLLISELEKLTGQTSIIIKKNYLLFIATMPCFFFRTSHLLLFSNPTVQMVPDIVPCPKQKEFYTPTQIYFYFFRKKQINYTSQITMRCHMIWPPLHIFILLLFIYFAFSGYSSYTLLK